MGIFGFFGRSKPTPDKIPARTNSAPEQGPGRAAVARDAIPEPKSIRELVERIESDPQFLLGKLVIKSLVCSAKVSIECDDSHRDDADQLTELWEKSLPDAFECFGYGRVCFEKRYGTYANGRRPIVGLDPLPFEDTEMILDDAGQFTDVSVKTKSETLTLDSSCVWWCALDATPKQPHGRSRYHGAPLKVWRWRLQSDSNWEIFEKKHALGHGVMRAPSATRNNINTPGDIGELGQNGTPVNPADACIAMLDTLRSGGVAILPSEYDPTTNQKLYDYEPPTTKLDASPIENRRRVLDAMALRSLGVPERAVTQDEATGSYGMAEVHRKVLANTCEEILQQILTSFQEGVVDPWAKQNYGDGVKFFVVSQPIVDESKQLVVDVIKAIITGQSPMAEALDIAKLLEIADLPASENIGDVLEKVFKQISVASAPQPGFGPPSPFPRLASLRRLAADKPNSPPINDTWEDVADQAVKETTDLAAKIKDLPQSANAGRLLRQDT